MLIKFRVKLVSKLESRIKVSIQIRMDGNGWMHASIDGLNYTISTEIE